MSITLLGTFDIHMEHTFSNAYVLCTNYSMESCLAVAISSYTSDIIYLLRG